MKLRHANSFFYTFRLSCECVSFIITRARIVHFLKQKESRAQIVAFFLVEINLRSSCFAHAWNGKIIKMLVKVEKVTFNQIQHPRDFWKSNTHDSIESKESSYGGDTDKISSQKSEYYRNYLFNLLHQSRLLFSFLRFYLSYCYVCDKRGASGGNVIATILDSKWKPVSA